MSANVAKEDNMTIDSVSLLVKALNIIEKKVGEMGGEIGCRMEMNVGTIIHTATIHLVFPSERLREYISQLPEEE